MFKRIDRSKVLIRLFARFSDLFAERSGLPIVMGVVFVAVGLILQIINLISANEIVELFGVLFNGVGVLIALVGILLVTPLGGR